MGDVEPEMKIALVGRNAGKSSFVNALAREPRSSGDRRTTRDAVDALRDGRADDGRDRHGGRAGSKFADAVEQFANMRMAQSVSADVVAADRRDGEDLGDR